MDSEAWDRWLLHLSVQDKAIHAVLYDWANALSDGTAQYRQPDPSYERPAGAKEWTDERLEALLREIDEYVWAQAAWTKTNRGIEADAGPGYLRLAPPQRLALAQDLERAILANPDPDKPYPVPVPLADVTTEGWVV